MRDVTTTAPRSSTSPAGASSWFVDADYDVATFR
jgi:hypothetical protein